MELELLPDPRCVSTQILGEHSTRSNENLKNLGGLGDGGIFTELHSSCGRREAASSFSRHIRAALNKQSHSLNTVPTRRYVQGCLTLLIHRLDVRAEVKQQPGLSVPSSCVSMQRGHTARIDCFNIGAMIYKPSSDNCRAGGKTKRCALPIPTPRVDLAGVEHGEHCRLVAISEKVFKILRKSGTQLLHHVEIVSGCRGWAMAS